MEEIKASSESENRQLEENSREVRIGPFFREFDENGYLIIDNLLPIEFVNQLNEEVSAKINSIFNRIEKLELPFGVGVKNGYKEIVQRQELRYEVKLFEINDLTADNVDPLDLKLHEYLTRILSNERLKEIVSDVLQTTDYKVIHKSCVISRPGTTEQKWHSDGPHMSVLEYQPCHCFNLFIPLIDLTLEHGPTDIRPGSHRYTNDLTKAMLLAKLRKQLRPVVTPLIAKGSALMFDYRVLHRGGANSTTEVRPILVFTFAKPWYKDNLNFPSRSIYD